MEVQHQEHAHVPGSGAQPAAAASTALRDTVPEDMQAMAPEYTSLSARQHVIVIRSCALHCCLWSLLPLILLMLLSAVQSAVLAG